MFQHDEDQRVERMRKTASRINLENEIDDHFSRLDITVDHDNLLNGVKKVIETVFPEWPEVHKKFTQFTNGLTNKIFLCEVEGTENAALVRVYGKKTEALIDREQEIINLVTLGKTSLGPKLYGVFQNGYCYGFLRGAPISKEDMKDSHIMSLTAKYLFKWHNTHVSGITDALLWTTMYKWFELVPETFTDPKKDKLFREQNLSKSWIKDELDSLKVALDKLNSPVVFAHNDLLSKNILFDGEKDCVWFIDYEYATYSYRGFDIGNHFCEFAGMEEPINFDAYPTKAEQVVFLREYCSQMEKEVNDELIEKLYIEVNQFALAAHFYWGLWAFIQAETSDIDYNYLGFGLARLTEYKAKKDEFLALSL